MLPILLIGFAFTAIGILMIRAGESHGWFVAAVFGVGVSAALTGLLPGSSYLELRPEGFVVCSMYHRSRQTPWNEVDEFHVIRVTTRKMVVFNYRTPGHGALTRDIARGLTGVEGGLPDNYGLKAEELAALLNEWRTRCG